MKFIGILYLIFVSIIATQAISSVHGQTGNDSASAVAITKDEFSEDIETSGSSDEFTEFSESSDEFSEFEGDVAPVVDSDMGYSRAWWDIAVLAFTILAAIFVRYRFTRNLRPVFLVAAIVFLGFYRGGPGIISSLQNTYLYFLGLSTNWQAIILFLGLIPLSYFFGRVFCGWVCYLGALQEFLYIGRIKIFQSEKAQKVMRIIRYVVFVVLIIQLSVTHTILWNKIGPFKVAFNLFSPNNTGYVLLGILLFSSLFIYRPFCKAICPAGLIFGWISKIPGASVIGINDSCSGCKTCSTSCKINAITRENNVSKLDNQECIMCGDCLSDCKINSNGLFRNNNKHHGKTKFTSIS